MPVKPKHAGDEPNQEKKEVVEEIFIPEEPKWSLDEIILPEEVRAQILDVATYADNAHRVFELWGFKRTHKFSRRIGINLYGAPGTGKTMAAHAIAKNLGRKILIVNYADIESKYVGETPKNIRKAFEAAKNSDSILFFDEADAILSKRVTNMTQAVDVSVNQTRSVMLMLMNEFQDFIIFATNFIENFDPAFMRRISIHVKFTLPDEDCRKKLWRMYTPPEVPNNLDFDELAKKFDGISGSDISNAMLNAAFKAARLKADELDKTFVFEAVENILASKRANAGNF
ncbi:MAG: 26S protease regulatory subunit [Selenomonadaceae bacterium]|nr:26S protease regulatory subunit [Selenomonadaceae bacterium]